MHVAHKSIKQKIVIQTEIYLSGIAEMIPSCTRTAEYNGRKWKG